ncbi:PGF-pre-PGF domain-containing protein, partial [Candidatus Woesearchaeota archaeon]|nr:PGF-pre-PGF domain-containing protein [Candidatus Woesearchaeota archaeon]
MKDKFMSDIVFLVMFFFSLVIFSESVEATFYFAGYTYNASGAILNGTNVTMNVYQSGSLNTVGIVSTLVNNASHGFFNLTIPALLDDNTYSYRPVIRHFNNSIDVDSVGKTLPDFPRDELNGLGAIKFYLKSGVTVNLTAYNASGAAQQFYYMVKDVQLGYPIYSEWTSLVYNTTFNLPLDKNYSLMIFPQNSFPVSYSLNDYTRNTTFQNVTHVPEHLDVRMNISNTFRSVSGNLSLKDGSVGFERLQIVNYLYEPGSMVFLGHPLPYNMSGWVCTAPGVCNSDTYNNNSGFYNITLPGAAMNITMMLFAFGIKDGVHYGGFKNITLSYSTDKVEGFNFTMLPLRGDSLNITVDNVGIQGANINFSTKGVIFRLQNTSNGAVTNAHVECDLDYSSDYAGGPVFTWMYDDSSTNGQFALPLINSSVKKMNLYLPSYAPKKTSFTAAQIAANATTINLSFFDPGEIDSSEAVADSALDIGMYLSNTACSVPYPTTDCALLNDSSFDTFNPLSVIMGGGKIDFSMKMRSTNITIKYVDVDLIASGPPDALFDSDSSDASSGAGLAEAWRFGSQGPTIYSYVWVGIPYAATVDEAAPLKVLLNNLYDENWNSVWNSTSNTRGEGFTSVSDGDYADFNQSWLNSTAGGMPCSLTDQTQNCYINTTNNMIWLKIPHFSGIGPTVSSTTLGNVTLNASVSSISCNVNCTVYINVTNGNFTIYQELQNVSLNNSNSKGNVLNFTIYKYNETDWALNNTNSTLHSQYNFTIANGSDKNLHRYKFVITKTNTTSTLWNFSLNYTINSSGFTLVQYLAINLTCSESWSCTDWSTCSDSTQTRTCSEANSCGTIDNRPALSQSCTVSSTSSSGGSRPGGAGGGIPTGAAGKFAQETWTSINAGETATVEVENGAIGVTEVSFAVDETTYGAWVKVEKVDSLPSSVSSFGGDVYRNIKISHSNVEKALKGSATIDFKVEKAWLKENNLLQNEVALYRNVENTWVQLATTVGEDDGTYVHYTAETPGFSYFVIGVKEGAVPSVVKEVEEVSKEAVKAAEPTAEETEEAAKETEAKPAAWKWLLSVILAVIAILALAWFYLK